MESHQRKCGGQPVGMQRRASAESMQLNDEAAPRGGPATKFRPSRLAAKKRKRRKKKCPRPAARFLRPLRLFAAEYFLAKRGDSAEQQSKAF